MRDPTAIVDLRSGRCPDCGVTYMWEGDLRLSDAECKDCGQPLGRVVRKRAAGAVQVEADWLRKEAP